MSSIAACGRFASGQAEPRIGKPILECICALSVRRFWRGSPKSAHHQWKVKTMRSKISHIQFNVQAANLPFYKDLLAFAGLQTLYEGEGTLGVGDENETSMWFSTSAKDVANDYDGPGMNHLALDVPAQSDVDAAVAYLTERGVPA